MDKRTPCWVPLALFCGLLLTQTAFADTIDQSFLAPGSAFPLSGNAAQTFTAGITGQLTTLRFTLLGSPLPSVLSITDVTASGTPGTTVLGSVTIPANALFVLDIASSGNTCTLFNCSLQLSLPPGINVVSGTQYAIVWQGAANWSAAQGNQYAQGAAYVDFGGSGTWSPFSGLDFNFETHVSPVPEPGTLALLSTGLAGLLATRRKKSD